MTTAHFQNLSEIICRHLSEARQHIRIAVCWFSHKGIFDTLLARLRAGVRVELLLEYDSQNIRDDGLDFQLFIRHGGHLYAHLEAGLMHHKFAVGAAGSAVSGLGVAGIAGGDWEING